MAKKFKRVKKKVFPKVEFTLPEVYGDAVFNLPDLASFDLKTQRRLGAGDTDALFSQLEEAGVDAETRDAIDDLQGDDVTALMEAWGKVSAVDAGKSKRS